MDVFSGGAVVLGLEHKSTAHFGMYARVADKGSGQAAILATDNIEFLSDHGSAINMHANYYNFSDNSMESYSLDGLIYLLSYFGNMGTNHNGQLGYALSKRVSTPSVNLESVPSPLNSDEISKLARFWNHDIMHIKASFGRKSLNAGININFKMLGLAGPFTWFEDKNSQYVYHNMSNVYEFKTLLGPNIAYRKSIKNFSIVSLVGVNFCGNFSQANMKVKYNPFVDVNLFFGKQLGGTVGFKYEFIKGSVTTSHSGEGFKSDVTVNQLEFKVGIYIGGRKSSKK